MEAASSTERIAEARRSTARTLRNAPSAGTLHVIMEIWVAGLLPQCTRYGRDPWPPQSTRSLSETVKFRINANRYAMHRSCYSLMLGSRFSFFFHKFSPRSFEVTRTVPRYHHEDGRGQQYGIWASMFVIRENLDDGFSQCSLLYRTMTILAVKLAPISRYCGDSGENGSQFYATFSFRRFEAFPRGESFIFVVIAAIVESESTHACNRVGPSNNYAFH